jgi:hypothetical protein
MHFRNPLDYRPMEFHIVMNIPITVDIGHHRLPGTIESIDGVITSAKLADNAQFVETLTITSTTGEVRTINLRMVKAFRERN